MSAMLHALKPGAKIAVLSPASPPKKAALEHGLKMLRGMGYDPVLSPHALDHGPLYYAGPAAERLDDLHRAFSDKEIAAILCTRGGYGSVELLPLLNAKLIAGNPKPLIGYSDITALQLWLQQQCGMVTFYGPMAATDFGAVGGVDLASWKHALEGDAIPWRVGAREGLCVLKPGHASGILRGGCLSILTAALGTPFAPQFSGDTILFLEDINAWPYQVDRMLVQLRYALTPQKVRGILFGVMKGSSDPSDPVDERGITVENAVLHALADFDGPIGFGLRSGHVNGPNVTLPLGVAAELDLTDNTEPRLNFLQASVNL